MAQTVTYGVYGLIDWRARIPLGPARLTVTFSGGALTKYGTSPAEFTTSDPFIQRAVEDSEYFRSGRIVELRRSGRPDAAKAPVRQPANAQVRQPPAAPAAEEKTMTLEDAMEYLHNHQGENYSYLSTPEKVREAALRHGIDLTIV